MSKRLHLTPNQLPTRLILAVSVVCFLTLNIQAQQAKPRPRPKAATVNEVIPELTELLKKHDAALQTGDAAEITASSKALAAASLRLMAGVRLRRGALAESIEAYRRSLELNASSETRLDLALAQTRAESLDEALAGTEAVLQADPKNARAWLVKSKVLQARGDYADEAAALAKSLELSPGFDAEYAMGVALLKAGQKDRADAVFQQIIASRGDRAVLHVMFGAAYRETENFPDAVRELKQALARDPSAKYAHFLLGCSYLSENHYAPNEETVREFRQSVRQVPDDFFGNLYLGVIESNRKQFAESNQHLLTAAKANPGRTETWLHLGLNAYQQNDYPNAKDYFLKAIALAEAQGAENYQMRRAYSSLGRILASEGNREEAAKYVRRAKEMESMALQDSHDPTGNMQGQGMGQGASVFSLLPRPQPGTAETGEISFDADMRKKQKADPAERSLRRVVAASMNDWGTAEARQELFGQALIHFHEAERWDDSVPGLMRNIGMAAFRVEGYPEAVRALRVVLEQNPDDKLARAMFAVSLFSLNRYEQAAREFKAVGDEAWNDPRMAYAWAFSLSRINQPRESNAILGRLTAGPLPADMLLLAGQVYGSIGDHEQAVQCFRKAAGSDPLLQKAHYSAGLALIRLDRPTEAIPEFQAELKLTPDDPEVKYHLAFALLQASHTAEAVALLRAIVETNPGHAQAHYQLGKELLDEGSIEESIRYLSAAAELDPGKDYIHYQLQTAYRRAGHKVEADRELKAYQDIKNKARGRSTSAH